MRLSVIITAYDAHEVTTLHVKEAMNSSRIPDEIIVVNDHGDHNLKEMLQKLDKKCPIIYAYIMEDIEWNYTGARNLGYWLSRGDFVSMEDTDNIPSTEAYKDALAFMEENPHVGRLLYGRRPKVYLKDIKGKEQKDWPDVLGARPAHQDTQMLRREVYMKVKGCDERFAGRYAWACADWRRRLNRAGIESAQAFTHFWAIIDGETQGLVRRKSYKNYGLAREKDGHIQSPIGVINFKYEFEIL